MKCYCIIKHNMTVQLIHVKVIVNKYDSCRHQSEKISQIYKSYLHETIIKIGRDLRFGSITIFYASREESLDVIMSNMCFHNLCY